VTGLLLLSLGLLNGAAVPQAAPAGAPVPVTFTLRLADGRARFHPGEIIPIELVFTSSIPDRFILDSATYDRSGRLTIDVFRVEPIDRVSDPLLDYFASAGGFIGGGLRGNPVLGEKPTIVKLELNEWFRFDQPGTFRLSARSRRVTDESGGVRSGLVVESNAVTFEILPPDADWAAATTSSAVRLLDTSAPDVDRRQGCRILRFLATDASVDEMIARYDDDRSSCRFDFMAGLFTAPNRERVVRQMEAALKRPDLAISESFLQTLAVLALYVSHPDYRPIQTADNKGRLPHPGELAQRRALVDEEIARYRAVVLTALPDKAGSARAITLADQLAATRRTGVSPESDDAIRHELTASFLDLPLDRQLQLLQYSWSRLAHPELVPVLRQLVANGPAVNQPFGDIALRRLYQLAPDEGRSTILREIAAPRRGATLRTLGSLPDRELPQLDDRLASNVESASGFEDFSIRAELLQRYATAAVAPRVLASVRSKLNTLACSPKAALLAYFLRVDGTLGAELLKAALAQRERTGCYESLLRDVAKLHMAPELEAVAIAHLQDPAPRVAANAADMLGRYGSPAAVAPLRAAFERSHAERDESALEYRLFDALAAGRGWLTDRREVQTLRGSCVSENCRAHADGLLDRIASGRIDVTVFDGDDASVQIAQYQFESLVDLERKLAQYPAGARFQLRVFAPSPTVEKSVIERIRATARARGITIE
jgi:hypothetical protein